MTKLGNYVKDKAVWLGNKFITPTATAAGIGAAGGIDDGTPMAAYALKGAVEFPYKLATAIVTDEGIIGEVAHMCMDLGENFFDRPYETAGAIGAGVVGGTVLRGIAEHKRLKKKYGTNNDI